MENGKRVSDGKIGLTYPPTVLNTRLLKYPFTIPYPIRERGKLVSRGLGNI